MRELEINSTYKMLRAEEILADRRRVINKEQQEGFNNLIMLGESFASRLAMASLEGQKMEQVVVSALNSIVAEFTAKTAIFGLMSALPMLPFLQGTNVAHMAGQATQGGLFNFLLSGFTGQTPKVNQTININGGLVSQSYVKNTLIPAINNARAIG